MQMPTGDLKDRADRLRAAAARHIDAAMVDLALARLALAIAEAEKESPDGVGHPVGAWISQANENNPRETPRHGNVYNIDDYRAT